MGHLTDDYNLKFKCEKRSGIIIVWSIPNSVYLKKSPIHIPPPLYPEVKMIKISNLRSSLYITSIHVGTYLIYLLQKACIVQLKKFK